MARATTTSVSGEQHGYSPKTAAVKASQLLRNLKVREELKKILAKLTERLELTAERVLRELARIAFHDPRKFFREDGRLKRITELDDDTARALASMEVRGAMTKIRFADKIRALELLGRHLGLFTDKLEVTGLETLAERLAEARKRLEGR